ncbi:hypothetical protein [Variovorax sp. JS1663]|uniref:hypothetical protein n=1 Tax=Variovorax sp. JS1663 TaxID=1851577 RepID=UPI002357A33C|nr:hypothetical protein [Variovorax sp. JS1663]
MNGACVLHSATPDKQDPHAAITAVTAVTAITATHEPGVREADLTTKQRSATASAAATKAAGVEHRASAITAVTSVDLRRVACRAITREDQAKAATTTATAATTSSQRASGAILAAQQAGVVPLSGAPNAPTTTACAACAVRATLAAAAANP